MAKHIALAFLLLVSFKPTTAQVITNASDRGDVRLKAFSYFQRIPDQEFDKFLETIRPTKLTPDLRARVLGMIPKNDLAKENAEDTAKLRALDQILRYHQRDSVIEIKILRAHTASAVFLAGAAVLVTDSAMHLLSAEELQAVVAHELGHEYYWNRFEAARQSKNYSELQELELRCDGIAVIALKHVGINPDNLITALKKLNKHNAKFGSIDSPHYVTFDQRVVFIQQIIELVSTSSASIDINGGAD